MRYTKREKLSIINLKEIRSTVTYEEVIDVLQERPANIIYVMYEGRLHGIISVGDIERAKYHEEKEITINTKFTQIKPGGVLEARQIFKTKPGIKGLPIIDENGEFLGEYSCWGEYFNHELVDIFEKEEQIRGYLKARYKLIVLVKPSMIYERKMQLVNRIDDLLRKKGICTEIIERKNLIEEINKADLILFADEDEMIGTKVLYQTLLNKELNLKKITTIKTEKHRIINVVKEKEVFPAFLQELKRKGVHVFAFGFLESKESNLLEIYEKIREKYNKAGKIGLEIGVHFHSQEAKQNFYKEEFEKIENFESKQEIKFPVVFTNIVENGIRKLADMETSLIQIKNGRRYTTNQPQDKKQHVYMYGPCIVAGSYVEDNFTIASYLQDNVNKISSTCCVENCGGAVFNLDNMQDIEATSLKEGDIVLFYDREVMFDNVPYINLTDIYIEENISVNDITDHCVHCNHVANKAIAKVLFERIAPFIEKNDSAREIKIKKEIGIKYYVNMYKEKVGSTADGIIGSIVMNCNPFTYGHRYLIEEASKQVDKLIIFVVEEDKSYFSFEERFAMVRGGVADLENVVVIPSGDYILSNTTFPQYFAKVVDTELVHNVEKDITLFAEQIAPRFNITYRFVGEEPEDQVTNEYNAAMKKILPVHGIKLVEIPRKQKHNKVISASFVRKLIEKGEYDKIDELIPESTQKSLLWSNY